MKQTGVIDTLENVIVSLDAKKRNCRRDKNTVEFSLLRDAVYYLSQYQHLCNVLGETLKNSNQYREDDEDETTTRWQ